MFNVLPTNLKKLLTHEYHVRLVIVACALLLVVEVSCLIFLLPSWLISVITKQEITRSIATLQHSSGTVRTPGISDTVASTNALLHTIHTSMTYPLAQPFLDTILSRKSVGIRLTEFVYSTTDATHATLSIQGTAATRAGLVSFVKSLQDSGVFGTVDLPVSDLAKETNITFEIQLTIQP